MHTPDFGVSEVLEDALVVVENGVINDVIRKDNTNWQTALDSATRLIQIEDGNFVLPGFVDTHIHAPQWPQLGKALHLPLEQWLFENTFPLESRYADAAFAKATYEDLVPTLLANGTTTAVYYGTIHARANQILAETCLAYGQRAFVGKVAMDHPEQCPDYYKDASVESALIETRDFISFTREMTGNNDALVRPVVTPRFIPSCTDALLEGLGEIAGEMACHIQTHCSESDWEHQHVIDRLGKTDTQALDDFSLLTRTSLLAHANFITDDDGAAIKRTGAGIAHCPLSNHYFANSVFPLRAMVARGIRVGLGTDISGGPSASMFASCRHAVTASRALDAGVDPARPASERGRPKSAIDFRHAFWLATAGGGAAIDIPVGKFAPGYHFDANVVATKRTASNLRYHDADTYDDLFQKIVYGAERSDIRQVWVNGHDLSHNMTARNQ